MIFMKQLAKLILVALAVLITCPEISAAPVTKIQVRRGPEAQLPARLSMGEPAMTTDSHRVFFGYSTGKEELTRDAVFRTYTGNAAARLAAMQANIASKAAADHSQTISTVIGLQTALDGKETAGTAATHAAATNSAHGGIVAATDPRLTDARTPLAHTQPASTVTGLATVATSGSYPDLINQPIFTRGYDGREIEVQNTGTYIQWRYITDPAGTWINLASIASLTGANGANGKTVLSGSGAPANSLGVDGDFYIDLPAVHFYGPKASGVWSAYIDLIGPAGPPGPSASVTQSAVIGALDDPTDGAVVLLQQGPTEAGTAAKLAVADNVGNTKFWLDNTGALVRQCLSGETGYAVKVLSYTGEVLYSVTCNNSIVFKGSLTIK